MNNVSKDSEINAGRIDFPIAGMTCALFAAKIELPNFLP
jgi:hypothetical protein